MKRIIYSFLLVALLSCGPSHPLNYVKIDFRNRSSDNFYLDSIHDSTLAVRRIGATGDSMMTIRFDTIEHIYLQGNTLLGEWTGCFGGLALGMGVRQVVVSPYDRSHDDGLTGVVVMPFVPLGILIGNKIADKMHEIDLLSPSGQDRLKRGIRESKE